MNNMKVEEVALRLGVSVHTLNRWYRLRKRYPENECFKELPDYVLQQTKFGTIRLWSAEDVWKLLEFKSHIKSGRNGQMGKYNGTGTKNSKEHKEDK